MLLRDQNTCQRMKVNTNVELLILRDAIFQPYHCLRQLLPCVIIFAAMMRTACCYDAWRVITAAMLPC